MEYTPDACLGCYFKPDTLDAPGAGRTTIEQLTAGLVLCCRGANDSSSSREVVNGEAITDGYLGSIHEEHHNLCFIPKSDILRNPNLVGFPS